MEDESSRHRNLVRVLVAVLVLAGLVWLWWSWIPVLYQGVNDITPAERLRAIVDTRTALLAGLAAAGALGTFFVNARTHRLAVGTLRISEANLQLAQRGHLTDRYAKAIEQLGSDKLDVRLGGIYALEQIATDSPQDRDHATIVEVLGAFVRVHTLPTLDQSLSPEQLVPEPTKGIPVPEFISGDKRPAVDVQAAATVLGRLPKRIEGQRADLSGACLIGADLYRSSLVRADLRRADLTGADLTHADLRGATLDNAGLTRAVLSSAHLHDVYAVNATLTDAMIDHAKLTNASLAVQIY